MKGERRSLWGAALLGLALVVCSSGCAVVNPQSAVRLSSQALLTTRSLIQTLEDARTGLSIYVEGKALSGPLLNQEPLARETLCSITSAQRSLRLRVQLLSKLTVLYDHFADLATQGREDAGIFDNVIGEIDPADYPVDPPLVADCPSDGEVAPPPDPAAGPVASPSSPSPWSGVSRSRSLRFASMRIRQVLVRVIALLEKELPIYASLQREALRSRKGLAKALLLKFGTVSPGDLLAPQLQDLGLRWDELQFQRQQQDWPPAKRAAVQAALDKRPNQGPLISALKATVAHQHQLQSQGAGTGSQSQQPQLGFGINQGTWAPGNPMIQDSPIFPMPGRS